MNINELKEIVKNAPEGATHYIDNTYFRKRTNFPVGTWFEFTDKSAGFELTQASNLPEVARLEDIRTIIEMYEVASLVYLTRNNGELDEKIAKTLERFK